MQETPAIDLAEFREITADDSELMTQMLALFKADTAKHLARITAAVAGGDATELRSAAHALKGAAGAIAAEALRATAGDLEAAGRSGDLTTVDVSLARLTREVRRAAAQIDALLANEPASMDAA
jgi:HPt (histidine-containing phosphotransfer) domain-containing protein